ncbi:DUF3311 domain-containing protein [Bacillus massiliigorillae]|uniref:DUF3311 domain-containing protein n=1 Tax=Bacillus massiliigorillae TaxID=1243664 RepID=UPI0003A1439C|nr:DUF3311 domain-containing protein [Bacillus massiliigorillae]
MKLIHILSIIPFVLALGLLPLVNKVQIYVLGMPFLLFWVVIWTVLISGILYVVYKLDPANQEGDEE